MKRIALILLVFALSVGSAFALTGSWRGEIKVGRSHLPLVFNFSDSAGVMTCTLDSPQQGAKGIASRVLHNSSDSIALWFTKIGAKYCAKVTPTVIEGVFSQRGVKMPLTLTPEEPLEARRPQTPRPPFPYTVIDTVFTAPDGARLSGTVTLPAGMKKKTPAVVLISGSGAQNRDEELFEHRPFAVIADYLARNGVASLRYDDRGTAASEGDFAESTTFTFKDDAHSAIDFLRTFRGVGQVGVIGHSEGGTIAFMLGAERVPDFIISLAGMAESGKQTLLRQNSLALDKAGITGRDKDDALALIGHTFDIMAQQRRNDAVAPIDLDSLSAAYGLNVPAAILTSLKMNQRALRTPWFDTTIGIDPAEYLRSVRCPMLALNGSLDTQVEAGPNTEVIKANVPKARIVVLPQFNHLFQHATTGDVSEYGEIRETISPEVLDTILQFIIKP